MYCSTFDVIQCTAKTMRVTSQRKLPVQICHIKLGSNMVLLEAALRQRFFSADKVLVQDRGSERGLSWEHEQEQQVV